MRRRRCNPDDPSPAGRSHDGRLVGKDSIPLWHHPKPTNVWSEPFLHLGVWWCRRCGAIGFQPYYRADNMHPERRQAIRWRFPDRVRPT